MNQLVEKYKRWKRVDTPGRLDMIAGISFLSVCLLLVVVMWLT